MGGESEEIEDVGWLTLLNLLLAPESHYLSVWRRCCYERSPRKGGRNSRKSVVRSV